MGMFKRAVEDVVDRLATMTDREIAAYHNICVMHMSMIQSDDSKFRNDVHLEACRWIIQERSGADKDLSSLFFTGNKCNLIKVNKTVFAKESK